MSIRHDATYWGATLPDHSNDVRKTCGIGKIIKVTSDNPDIHDKFFTLTAEDDALIEEITSNIERHKTGDTTDYATAAQTVAHMKQARGIREDVVRPEACNEEAPNAINKYGDGSFLHPRQQAYGLAGAGVWY